MRHLLGRFSLIFVLSLAGVGCFATARAFRGRSFLSLSVKPRGNGQTNRGKGRISRGTIRHRRSLSSPEQSHEVWKNPVIALAEESCDRCSPVSACIRSCEEKIGTIESDIPRKTESMEAVMRLRGGSTTDWRYFVAGGVCAALSHGVTTPIDVVKTTIQANPERFGGKGLMEASMDIVRSNGPLFLLAGLGPTLLGYGLEGALKFGSYETLKVLLADLSRNQAVNFIVASILAGIIASIALCPLEDARIKMVSDPAFAHLSTLGAVALAARREGPLSLFHGLGALLMKQIPYTSVKQVSFDLIARALYSLSAQLHGGSTVRNGGLIALTSAFVTSILSCLASQPGDMVLTAMCQSSHIHQHVHSSACNQLGCDGTSVAAYDQINKIHSASGPAREPVTTQSVNNLSAWRTAINIYKSRGIGGFFIGTQARLLHVVAIVTSQLVIYDAVKRLLGLAATGTH